MSCNDFLRQSGNYENWNVYKLSLVVCDITDYFCRTYLNLYRDRTVDQMRQAARSGKQNIVEGSCAAATSRETEIKLTNVAKASLKELLEDYKDYLRQNSLKLWDKNDQRVMQVRRFAKTHLNSDIYLLQCSERSPETICNIMITLLHQLDYLLYLVIERAKKSFLEKGGIKEEMYRARVEYRKINGYPTSSQRVQQRSGYQSYQSNQSAQQGSGYQSFQSNQSAQQRSGYQSYQSNQSAQQGYCSEPASIYNYAKPECSDYSDCSDNSCAKPECSDYSDNSLLPN